MDAIALEGVETVEFRNGGEVAVIVFKATEGTMPALALPLAEVLPLVMRLIGVPDAVDGHGTDNSPKELIILNPDRCGVTRLNVDENAVYVSLGFDRHEIATRIEHDVALRLRDALTEALGAPAARTGTGSDSRH